MYVSVLQCVILSKITCMFIDCLSCIFLILLNKFNSIQFISKSTLKNMLKVEVTGRYAPKATSVIIDGSAILWVVHGPTQGTVQYLVGNVV